MLTLNSGDEQTPPRQQVRSGASVLDSGKAAQGIESAQGQHRARGAEVRALVEQRRHERRPRRVHPPYQRPELVATEPNHVWSWDLTKLRGPAKWVYYHLYVLMDLFSRFVVGWMLARGESGTLARRLIAESCARKGIRSGQLTIHADRGAAPASKTVAHGSSASQAPLFPFR